jgi:glycerol uptake facilitator-like aquaporin
MDKTLPRSVYLVELLGSFAFILVSAGVVIVNQVAQPAGAEPGQAHLFAHQPGLLGIALAQGLILAAMLSVTLPLSPGCLNPAFVLMNWVMGRLATVNMAGLLVAQLAGGILAGACLRFSFTDDVLRSAHLGTPHWQTLTYGPMTRMGLVTGSFVELVLTFFLVLVILCALREGPRATAWAGGVALSALVLVGFPLTGAALNPTRWFGTVFWELAVPEGLVAPLPDRGSPLADVFVYAAGPVVGALLAGIVHARMIVPALATTVAATGEGTDSAKVGRAKK